VSGVTSLPRLRSLWLPRLPALRFALAHLPSLPCFLLLVWSRVQVRMRGSGRKTGEIKTGDEADGAFAPRRQSRREGLARGRGIPRERPGRVEEIETRED
jgi:hypothetical protein